MDVKTMTLAQVTERLGKIDEEVRSAKDEASVDALAKEKRDLLERKKELEDLETRKQTALDLGNGTVTGTVIEARGTAPAANIDKFDSLEYRKAFMEYCRNGTPIPAEYRIDSFTSVTDAAAVIPTSIMNEIIKQSKVYGQLFSRVRKINIQGGVRVPILSLKPTATRINETTVSDRKKIQANTYVTFSYYGLECRVAVSLLSSIVTLPMFEAQIAPLITEAMVKQQEYEIFNGTGEGMMLGVTVDTRVAAGQVITLSSTEIGQWDSWKKKVFAKIPLAYRAGGIFSMAAGTWDGYVDGMVDAHGQPIGRLTYGITEGSQQRFGGREVLLVEDDIIKPYDTADVGDVIAVFMNPSDYAINTNMQMAIYRWLDHDSNQYVDKAILISDGKLLDAGGVLIIKKGA